MSKPQTSINNKYDRVVVLIDMDCFYCQVEEQLNPELKGKPIAVVQYNAWRGGGIIAVNYPARAKGVTRHMRGDEAKEQCPDIELCRVPNIREKADLSKYRNAGKQVAAVLQTFTTLLTRASVDEAYLDITDQVQSRLVEMNQDKFALQPNALKNTFVVGYENIGQYVQEVSTKISKPTDDNEELMSVPEEDRKAYKRSDIKLLIASSIVSEIRAAVKEQTGYECSAGIAHNKILAKLICGLNKPNKQTIIPLKQIPQLFSTLPVRKVQGLGGKFGEKICEDLDIKFMGDLVNFSKEELQRRYDEKNGQWLYNIARGIDLEAVTTRLISKSIGCCKKFPGRNAITALTTLTHWMHELAQEIHERLEQDEMENNRRAKQMVVSYVQGINNTDVSSSRTVNLISYDEDRLVNDALDVLKKNTEKFFKSPDNQCLLNNPIKFLGLNVGKFESTDTKKGSTIQDMFKRNIENKKNETIVKENESETDPKSNEIPTTNTAVPSTSTETKENQSEKKPEKNQTSFFLKYRETMLLKQAEEKAAKEAELRNQSIESRRSETPSESIMSEEENTFQDELLLAELEDQNQSVQIVERPESPKPSTSSKPDYKQSYAEFYGTNFDLPKVECEQCGKKVVEYELQVHMDGHFAFQLNQEQRTEFQNQLKRTNTTKTAVTTPAAKKMKTQSGTKVPTPSKGISIQKFLVKSNQEQDENAASSESIETEKCKKCGKAIPITQILEHNDYHAAKELHEELMQAELAASRSRNVAATNNNGGATKKSKTQKKNVNGAANPVKNIASFFQGT